MNKYLIVTGDFVKTGGMDRVNYALASFLARRGDDVHLCAFRVADDLLAHPNVTFHRVPKPLKSYFLSLPLLARAGRRAAARMARGGGRVIVNGGNCPWDDVNWVHHVNASDPLSGGGNPLVRLKNRVQARQFIAEERAIIPRARLVITSCELTRDDLLGKVPALRPESVRIVYYGIDADLFRPADPAERAAIRARVGWDRDRPIALFIGGLGSNRKGIDRLYEAWSSLCRDPAWDADLAVVGVGTERPVWEGRAAAEGLADRIRFLGSRPDLPDLLRACDGHVLPSRYEGYSMVTQEALCCGVPAYITSRSGIAGRLPDDLRGELLIPDPEDVADLIARLRRWRDRIGRPWPELEAFGHRLRGHTWDAMSEQIAELIEAAPPRPAA